jgi:hypothetical protein
MKGIFNRAIKILRIHIRFTRVHILHYVKVSMQNDVILPRVLDAIS